MGDLLLQAADGFLQLVLPGMPELKGNLIGLEGSLPAPVLHERIPKICRVKGIPRAEPCRELVHLDRIEDIAPALMDDAQIIIDGRIVRVHHRRLDELRICLLQVPLLEVASSQAEQGGAALPALGRCAEMPDGLGNVPFLLPEDAQLVLGKRMMLVLPYRGLERLPGLLILSQVLLDNP